MTSYNVAQAVFRRWWVLLSALATTVLLALALTSSAPLYWARYDLNLVAPDRSGGVYSRTSAPSGVIPVAGVLQVLVGGNHPEPKAATDHPPIFGLRDRTGVQVVAKDNGSQWSPGYVGALSVQIAELSTAEVNEQAASFDARVAAALKQVQDRQGVPRVARITVEAPGVIEVVEVSPAKTRARVGVMVLGAALSLVATIRVDRWLIRRGGPRSRASRSASLRSAPA